MEPAPASPSQLKAHHPRCWPVNATWASFGSRRRTSIARECGQSRASEAHCPTISASLMASPQGEELVLGACMVVLTCWPSMHEHTACQQHVNSSIPCSGQPVHGIGIKLHPRLMCTCAGTMRCHRTPLVQPTGKRCAPLPDGSGLQVVLSALQRHGPIALCHTLNAAATTLNTPLYAHPAAHTPAQHPTQAGASGNQWPAVRR